MGSRLTNTLVLALVVIDAFLSLAAIPIHAGATATGTITFTVANHPPSISNVTVNQSNNTVTLVAVIHEDPDSLVDVDRVVVYVYQPRTNASLFILKMGALGFEWTRKGSRNSMDNCSDSIGCWYEQNSAGWNRSLEALASSSHGEISSKTTAGAWTFSFTISGCDSSNWNYVVTVHDRSNLTATAAGSFTVTCPST